MRERMAQRGKVEVYPDGAAASRAGAESFAERARAAVEANGRFSVALSGGSTPYAMYAMLAEEPLRSRIPWEGVHLFWGDDRCVPPAHPRSNFGMAREAFISRVPIPAENVHRMRGEIEPARAAEEYERELANHFGSGVPRFDLIHLGMGDDAHTASLFPFDEAVLRERERRVRVALFRALGEHRLTLTVPVLNAAARLEFLILDGEKAPVVRSVVRGALDPFRLPAQLVRPRDGELVWLLSHDAARDLEE
ncbi:6-phosphogluconolactonase [soil metagenome]